MLTQTDFFFERLKIFVQRAIISKNRIKLINAGMNK